MRIGVSELLDGPGELHLLVLGEHDRGMVSKRRQRRRAQKASGSNQACNEATGHCLSLMLFGKADRGFDQRETPPPAADVGTQRRFRIEANCRTRPESFAQLPHASE